MEPVARAAAAAGCAPTRGRGRRLVVATGDVGPAAVAYFGGPPSTPVADDASGAGGGDFGGPGLFDGGAIRKARLLETIVLGEPPPDCGWQGGATAAAAPDRPPL